MPVALVRRLVSKDRRESDGIVELTPEGNLIWRVVRCRIVCKYELLQIWDVLFDAAE